MRLGWLRHDEPDGTASRVDEELAALAEQAGAATGSARGHLFNRAGDLCAKAERRKDALASFGHAVDAYLAVHSAAPAAAVCRKMLRYAPSTVRAHLTLACLAVEQEDLALARQEVDAYVAAARRARTAELAIPRLQLLATTVRDPALRQVIAAHLAALGDAEGSARVTTGELAMGPSGADRWQRLMHAATLDPNEILQRD